MRVPVCGKWSVTPGVAFSWLERWFSLPSALSSILQFQRASEESSELGFRAEGKADPGLSLRSSRVCSSPEPASLTQAVLKEISPLITKRNGTLK